MTSTSKKMNEVLEDFVKVCIENLVEDLDSIFVQVILSTKSIMVNIKVDRTDLGRVIGRKGRTIEAIKLLVIAIKNTHFNDNRQVFLELLEDDNFVSFNKGGSGYDSQ